jgi:glutamyl-tRNA reductase
MRFQLIGVNHHTAPVEVRERLAIPESRLPEACKKLTEFPGIDEGMILSTCNRVEILANTKNGSGADLRGFIHSFFQLDGSDLDRHLYEYHEQEAVRQCFA